MICVRFGLEALWDASFQMISKGSPEVPSIGFSLSLEKRSRRGGIGAEALVRLYS